MTTLPVPSLTTQWLTNTAYGYPRGAVRRESPIALACLHVTDNPNSPPATATQERNYANRLNSGGPSAHLYVNRDGSGVWAIDPSKYAAWSNGAIRSPRLTVPGITDIVAFDADHNPNEAYLLEIEHCGRYPDFPITVAQMQTSALLIAKYALVSGLPIERRTVHLHGDLDSEQRANCPVPSAGREKWVASVIDMAVEYAYLLRIDSLTDQITDLTAELASVRVALSQSLADLGAARAQTALRERERDETLVWGRGLQSRAAAALATDPPDWAR